MSHKIYIQEIYYTLDLYQTIKEHRKQESTGASRYTVWQTLKKGEGGKVKKGQTQWDNKRGSFQDSEKFSFEMLYKSKFNIPLRFEIHFN